MRDYASLKSLLLADLQLSNDEASSYITSDMSANLVARKSLYTSFYKKLCPHGNTKIADVAALKKFKAVNTSLPVGPWSVVLRNEAESCFWDYFRDNLIIALEPREDQAFDIAYIRENMGIGPGAAQKADPRCMYTKLFESSISYTDETLITWYRAALVETGFWADAEMARFQKYGFVRVPGGKTFFAPKNAEISRTCSTEASLNMLIQKAIGTFIEERLGKHYKIFLKYQPDLNRELARIGSIDGSLATIDLVSASDCIGIHLLQRVLPDGFLKAAILRARSETTVLPDGSKMELNMVSTMGNGFTFPLQTLLFACAVRSVYQVMGFPCNDPSSEYGVFGDDIVVRRETYDFVCQMLTVLGFQVNCEKSFNTGPFRESCGHDYYLGHNVRGVYVKSLETPQQVCSLINRLHRWSARHGIMLPRVIKLLLTWTRDMRVPPSEADDSGIHVPFELTTPKVSNSYWFKYRIYKRRIGKMQLEDPDSGEPQPDLNQEGIAVCFLAGHIRRRDFSYTTEQSWLLNPDYLSTPVKEREGSWWQESAPLTVPLRDRIGVRARYKIASKSLPYWDWIRDPKDLDSETDGQLEWRDPLTRVSHDAWKSVVVASFSL